VTFEAHTPLWLELLVIVGVALSAAVLVFFLLDFFVRRKTPPLARSFERLAQEAQNAVDALQAGGDVKDIVIRSYLQMSLIVREELGLAREKAMTPDEFEQTLVSTGVPRQPVHHLTRLFEEVRYGNRPTGREDERQAIADLSAIAAFCRGSQITGAE
jgi:hypothetical protein